jgi:hypothetical protein
MSSFWEMTALVPHFDPLDGDLDVDVAILGAGISGLTAALLLAERGRSVAVLETETVAAGGASAHLTVAVDARYHFIRRKYGVEQARRVADSSRAALEKIAEIVDRYSIGCHFRRVPGYVYTEKRKYVAELKNEAGAATEAGLDARWIDAAPLPFATRGAVLWPDQAQLHPGEYLAGLAQHATNAGARIFARTTAREIDDGVIETGHGQVRAKDVIRPATVAGIIERHAMAFSVTGDHPDGLFRDASNHRAHWQETKEGTFLIVEGEDAGDLVSYARESFGVHAPHASWSSEISESQDITLCTAGAMLVVDHATGSATASPSSSALPAAGR